MVWWRLAKEPIDLTENVIVDLGILLLFVHGHTLSQDGALPADLVALLPEIRTTLGARVVWQVNVESRLGRSQGPSIRAVHLDIIITV